MADSQGFDGVERCGLMFVLSSPSGAGKTTLSRLLMERMPELSLSVSVTTRPMRPGEVEGRYYFFIDKARFDAMSKGGELLESATVFDHCYGTPRAPVEAALSSGRDVLFDIDWQGTQQLREKARADVVQEARRALRKYLQLTDSEFDWLVEIMFSQLDVSMSCVIQRDDR